MEPLALWALHIADGKLRPEWWLAGWPVAGLLMLFGAWRLRDEDIPRVALLAAAFFVVALIHVPVPGGPPAHLLMAGLLGVVLGRQAALAIPVGLILQTLLFSHGGLTMIGVNSVVMTVPALLCGGLFAGLRRLPGYRRPGFRTGLLFTSVVVFLLSTVFAVALLATNPWTETATLETAPALATTFAPTTLTLVVLAGLLLALLERRHPAGPEFALGLLVGELGVLAAVGLYGVVLLLGGVADWHAVVFLAVLVHLPLAVVEGVVLGFTIRFLARVQPELLGIAPEPPAEEPVPRERPALGGETVVALLLVLLVPTTARAHALLANYRVDPAAKVVTIECHYDTGDLPANATAIVRRGDGSELTRVKVDDKGRAQFSYTQAEELRVEIDAGGSHGAQLTIPAAALAGGGSGDSRVPYLHEVVSGLAFLLALGAFVLALRNSRRLARLEQVGKETPAR